jgi:predicted phosphodiesterase
VPLRLIGDVHGAYRPYLNLLKDASYSLQVGDLGMDYQPITLVNHKRHRAIAGNHDCYEPGHSYFRNHPIFLDDFGTYKVPDFGSVFYVRGAWSIDHFPRQLAMEQGHAPCWWAAEELEVGQLNEAIALYEQLKPDFVVTHEAPLSRVPDLTDPSFAIRFGYNGIIKTKTNQTLERMLEIHQPEVWVHGHYHVRHEQKVGRTRFICLDMIRGQESIKNAYIDLD